MIPTPTRHSASIRHRRIGRKVLQADRLARALGTSQNKTSKIPLHLPSVRPKVLAIACLMVAVVSVLGLTGAQAYRTQVAATKRAAVVEQQKQLQAKSAAADACRQKKVEQKADQLGKITYDELYDYDACDK